MPTPSRLDRRPTDRAPFWLPEVGLREISGMVWVEEGALMLSIQDALLGFLDVSRSQLRIEPEALEAVTLQHGWIRDRLLLRPWGSELLDLIPGNHPGEVSLRAWRSHRSTLELIESEMYRLLGPDS